MIGESEVAGFNSNVEYFVPTIPIPEGGFAEGGNADHFCIPTKASNLGDVSALPFRALRLIWNEFFRDENLQQPKLVNTGDTESDTIIAISKVLSRFGISAVVMTSTGLSSPTLVNSLFRLKRSMLMVLPKRMKKYSATRRPGMIIATVLIPFPENFEVIILVRSILGIMPIIMSPVLISPRIGLCPIPLISVELLPSLMRL